MKLLELRLHGFGRLVNRSFRFAPGFNLVVGPNEAGKSTLQQAILTLLYGYFDDGSVTTAKRELLTSNRPWDEDATGYGGWLSYSLDNGQQYRVERTFHPKLSTFLHSLPDLREVTDLYRSASYGRVYFADEQLGMSREVFENICSVRQTELEALESSANAITTTMMRLSASGAAETTTVAALAVLEQALLNQVGTSRAWTKPLARTTKHLSELQEVRRQASDERDGLFVKWTELQQIDDELRRLDIDMERMLYLQLFAERDHIASQIRSADEYAATISERAMEMRLWEKWASFPSHLRDEVISLAHQHEQLMAECAEAQMRSVQAQNALDPINREIADLQARIATLANADNTPVEALPIVEDLINQWHGAEEVQNASKERLTKCCIQLDAAKQQLNDLQTTLKPILRLGFAGVARLQQQLEDGRRKLRDAEHSCLQAQARWAKVGMNESQFQNLEQTVREIQSGVRPTPPQRTGCSPFASPSPQPTQPPTELVVYGQIRPIHSELIQCHTNLETARTNLAKTEAVTRQQLANDVPGLLTDQTFLSLQKQLETYAQAEAALNQRLKTVAEAELQLHADTELYNAATANLQSKLSELGYGEHALALAIEVYLSDCRDKQQLAQVRAFLDNQHLRAQVLTRDIEIFQQRQKALEQTNVNLSTLLAEAGIECAPENIERGIESFNVAATNHQQWLTAKASYEDAVRQLTVLKSFQEKGGIRAHMKQLEARMQASVELHPELADARPSTTAQEYAQEQRRLHESKRTVRDRQVQLRSAIGSTATELKHLATIDEEIAVAQTEEKRLKAYRDALELAHSELTEATKQYQRQFAPKLETQLSDALSRLTVGRYSQVKIDPSTLAVTLRLANSDTSIKSDRLSTGTRDLVYLMLRIGIAQIMSSSGEKPPLLLDDTLVHLDHDRYVRTLEFLQQLASETQMFLFTKDEWVADQWDHRFADSDMFALHRLG